jgi:hypothetical protein
MKRPPPTPALPAVKHVLMRPPLAKQHTCLSQLWWQPLGHQTSLSQHWWQPPGHQTSLQSSHHSPLPRHHPSLQLCQLSKLSMNLPQCPSAGKPVHCLLRSAPAGPPFPGGLTAPQLLAASVSYGEAVRGTPTTSGATRNAKPLVAH